MREKEFLPLLESKLGISELNTMQRKMLESSNDKKDIMLLSPTGSGKTIAFILPVLKMLKPSTGRVQCVVLAPSRELVIQIFGVFKNLAGKYKITALYGGHKVEDEVNSLKVIPDIIVATPGRMIDHLKRRNVDGIPVRILVLDEFDKILELGFEDEVKKIIGRLKNVSRNILISATKPDVLPAFLKLDNPIELNFLKQNHALRKRLMVNRVDSSGKDKLETLQVLLRNLSEGEAPQKSIVFVNHRESAERIADYLKRRKIDCVLYHGALEQRQRETAIVKFNNGSHPILVATDLAARGLDIEGVTNVIHYHQPLSPGAYTHRNGRTARVEEDGNVYIIVGPDEDIKEYVEIDKEFYPDTSVQSALQSGMATLAINAGKKEKVSKSDIVGFLIKECGLDASEVGKISVFDHYSFFTIPYGRVKEVIIKGDCQKLKGSKRRFTLS